MKDEEHRAARIQSELLSANKVAENWNIKYKSEKENREKLANQLLESNKLTNQKSEEIENVISEMERYRHLYNEISEKYNNERIVFKNNIGATRLEQINIGLSVHNLHCNNWSSKIDHLRCTSSEPTGLLYSVIPYTGT